MTQAMTIVGPNKIVYNADTIAPWAHPGTVNADPHQLVLRARAMLYNAQLNSRDWNPHPGELKLALVALVSMGLDLAPSAQECALLSFWDKKLGMHSVTPVVMKEGLRRLASELHPIVGEHTEIVVRGDKWNFKRSHRGVEFDWQPGDEAHKTSLVANSGVLNFEPIVALFTTIYFHGRDPFSEVLQGQRLHEKLANNRNAQSAGKKNKWGKVTQSPWLTNTWAMLEKTSVKHTYRRLPLRGRPAAAMRMDSLAEGRQLETMRAMLMEEARVRELPAHAVDDMGALQLPAPPNDEQDADADSAGYEFDAGPETTVEVIDSDGPPPSDEHMSRAYQGDAE